MTAIGEITEFAQTGRDFLIALVEHLG